ncbi:hypothetical protein [Agaribacter marinus]|nr:hypothetical protein [Agaribacter marinus]
MKVFTCFTLLVCLAFSSTLQSMTTSENASDIVVVVHAENSVRGLTKKQLVDIYMGRFKHFPNEEKASPIDFSSGSELRKEFYSALVGKTERSINAYWSVLLFSGRATAPKKVKSVKDVIYSLDADVSSIAYLRAKDVTPDMHVVYRFR